MAEFTLQRFQNDFAVENINSAAGVASVNTILSGEPSMALVIGTKAATPYVHLQLESAKRHAPGIPVLIHDDHSAERDRLLELCRRYGADLECNRTERGHTLGDLSVFVGGLGWAKNRGVDLLVKMSRRFLPVADWTHELAALARQSQHATYSGQCVTWNFGFRTECVAMHVGSWHSLGGYRELESLLTANHAPNIAEAIVHEASKRVHRHACAAARAYEAEHPNPPPHDGYCMWPLLGERKTFRRAEVMWHETHHAEEFYQQALKWGISEYPRGAFSL